MKDLAAPALNLDNSLKAASASWFPWQSHQSGRASGAKTTVSPCWICFTPSVLLSHVRREIQVCFPDWRKGHSEQDVWHRHEVQGKLDTSRPNCNNRNDQNKLCLWHSSRHLQPSRWPSSTRRTSRAAPSRSPMSAWTCATWAWTRCAPCAWSADRK